MSRFHSKIENWNFNWKSIPRNSSGTADVEIEPGKKISVKWRRDASGIWIILPHGVYGFDIAKLDENGGPPSYSLSRRGFSSEWPTVAPLFENEGHQSTATKAKPKDLKVKAQMPGKIIRILVKAGQEIRKDQPIVVMEAMKMENEIRAPMNGVVKEIKVAEGQAIESGVELLMIAPA